MEWNSSSNSSDNSSNNSSDVSGYPSFSYEDPEGAPIIVASKIIVGLTGVVGNLLVVIVFVRFKKLFQNVRTTFIVNQSVVDGIVSVILIVTAIISRVLKFDNPCLSLEQYSQILLAKFSAWALMTVSTYNLMAISTERT